MNRPARRAFSLLEVMIALAILVVSLVILMETQTSAMQMTREAQRMIISTNLAEEKIAEVTMLTEQEGFTDQDKCEDGNFDDFAEDAPELDFEQQFEDYRYEWCLSQIDLALAGSLMGAITSLQGEEGGGAAGGAAAGPLGMLSAFLTPDMITTMLAPYVRELRVVVWWGEDRKKAEELGDLIVLTTHVVNPTGAVIATEQNPLGAGS